MSELNGRLAVVVGRVLDLAPGQVENARVDNTPGWDSLTHLSLLMAIEEEYGVGFSPDEVDELDSVERIRAAVERLTGARASA
jgi:acyl carrier protein